MASTDYPVKDGNGATILPAGRGEAPAIVTAAAVTAALIAEMAASNFQLLYSVRANMNVTTDQPMAKHHDFDAYVVHSGRAVLVSGVSLTTAAGGVYTAAAKGGVAVVAASQTYTGLATVGFGANVAGAAGASFGRHTADLIFALTTAQGAAAVADILIFGANADINV